MSIEVTVRGIKIPPEELTWRFSRSPGPGGQSVNTTDSQAELSYDLAARRRCPRSSGSARWPRWRAGCLEGVYHVAASEYKSQLRNREAAAARLSALLTAATAPPRPPRRPTRPTRELGRAAAGREAAPVPG